jgi:hypothetical protein
MPMNRVKHDSAFKLEKQEMAEKHAGGKVKLMGRWIPKPTQFRSGL